MTAEGVETAVQRDLLKDLGCDEMQGYSSAGRFRRPRPAASCAPAPGCGRRNGLQDGRDGNGRAARPTGGAILTVAKYFGNEYDFNGPLDGSLFFIVSTKTND